MTNFIKNIKQGALELWQDDRGAEGLEKLLIIGAIALPLLAVLIFFSGELREWVSSRWESVQSTGDDESGIDDSPF